MEDSIAEQDNMRHEWIPSRELNATIDVRGTIEGRLESVTFRTGVAGPWKGEYALPFTPEICEYLDGDREYFSFEDSCRERIDRISGPFYRAVLRRTMKIPYGDTMAYSEVADSLGSRAHRATGSALAQNPIAIVVPCHRVVSKHGLGGFGGAVWLKRRLLELEGVDLP